MKPIPSNQQKGKDGRTPPAKPVQNQAGNQRLTIRTSPLEDEWGFHPGFEKLAEDGETYAPALARNRNGPAAAANPGLAQRAGPDELRRYVADHLLARTNAVVIERDFGKGSVVIATDSYFVSNESMEQDRHADLLAWLIGANKNVVFDEAHLASSKHRAWRG